MSELSNHIRRDVVETMRRMNGFELSEVPHFKNEYIVSHFLLHTELALFPRLGARLKKIRVVSQGVIHLCVNVVPKQKKG